MSVLKSIIDLTLCPDRCARKGHTIRPEVIENLGKGETETECTECGEPLFVFIDPHNEDYYRYRSV